MAGHSHAKNVAATKAKQDYRKAKINMRLTRTLMVLASKNPNPEINQALANQIKKSRAMGLPKSNIEKVLKDASGKGREELILERIIFEAYYCGIAMLVIVETEKNSRTAPEINNIFSKLGGEVKFGAKHLFKEVGLLKINLSSLILDCDQFEEIIIDYDWEDYEFYTEEDECGDKTEFCNVYFAVNGFGTVAGKMVDELEKLDKDAKSEEGFVAEEAIIYISEEKKKFEGDAEKFKRLIALLEENDDVIGVYHVADID
jgi:transcriptional/translational regulatory protein YebC/TACO1